METLTTEQEVELKKLEQKAVDSYRDPMTLKDYERLQELRQKANKFKNLKEGARL